MKRLVSVLFLAQSLASAQWIQIADIPSNRTVYTLFGVNDTLYAGTDSLFYEGLGSGAIWSVKASPAPFPDAVACLQKVKGELLAGTFQHGIFRSTTDGSSWLPFSTGLSGLGATDISGIVLRGDTLVAGTFGAAAFATPADFTHAWFPFGDSLVDYQGDNVFKIFGIGRTVLANAGGNGYIFRYSDARPWWDPVGINSPRLVGQAVTGLASFGDTVIAATNAGIYRSADEGITWDKGSYILPPSTLRTFVVFHGTLLFALSTTPFSSTLSFSKDFGDTWDPLGTFALPNLITVEVVSGILFAGGPGGLWAVQLSDFVTTVSDRRDIPAGFALEQNFPNPFNPSTVITYRVPVTSRVKMTLFDPLGRQIRTLVDAVRAAGEYRVTLDADALASGVYFVEFKAIAGADKVFVSAKKMMHVR